MYTLTGFIIYTLYIVPPINYSWTNYSELITLPSYLQNTHTHTEMGKELEKESMYIEPSSEALESGTHEEAAATKNNNFDDDGRAQRTGIRYTS